MPFNLNEFKAVVMAPQRPNHFEVEIGREGFANTKFIAEQIMFPSFEFKGNYATQRYGFGPLDIFPSGPAYQDIIITFIMEQGGEMYDKMRIWIDQIQNLSAIASGGTNSAQRDLFTVGYKDDYVARINIRMLPETDHVGGLFELIDAYPLGFTGEPFGWEISDSYMSFQIPFNFYQMTFTPDETSNPESGIPALKIRNFVPSVADLTSSPGALVPTPDPPPLIRELLGPPE